MQKLLQKIPKIKLKPKVYLELPENPGIYIYFKGGLPIYLGKAINLRRRVSSYFNIHLDPKTQQLMHEADQISYIKVANELESLLLEAKLIKYFLPKYNIISKDDKHALYIRITSEKYPRVITARKIDEDQKNMAFFGPFPSSTNVKFVLKMVRRIFPYADHKSGKRPCIYSQIGLCSPCPNEIENIQDQAQKSVLRSQYLKNIKNIKSLLSGKISSVRENLEKEMDNYSKQEDFELAADIRNKIKKLEYITNPTTLVDYYIENPNLYEDIRQKEIDELTEILYSKSLKVKNLSRIECFDVAHLQGVGGAASMVTFINGTAEKSSYRHFKIIQKHSQDDYESMREIAKRRKKHLKDWGRPDLIIVDGGKGQLSIFLMEMGEMGIPVIGLAKRFETLIIPSEKLGTTVISEYKLKKGSALNLVQRIRNEAHRFAQAYHHKLFSKSLFETSK